MNRTKLFSFTALFLGSLFFFSYSNAQKVEVDDDSTVQRTPVRHENGRKAAQKYFQERKGRGPAAASSGGDAHYLSLHLGKAFNEASNTR